MHTDNKIEEEIADKISQGSCKLSKSRKIKKPNEKPERSQKQKDKTPKITNFFKRLTNDHFQRPKHSSQKKQQKRSPQEEQRLQQLQNQQRQLQHEEQMLKKEIQTLKSEQQIMNEEWNWYIKRLRQCQIADIKERYQIIRLQKQLPEHNKIAINTPQLIQKQYPKQSFYPELTLQILEIQQKIKKKREILKSDTIISSIQRSNLSRDIENLQSQIRSLSYQNELHKQRITLSEKQKVCKFAQLNWPLINKRYQTLELIGSGGYSQVYKALNVLNDQIVAIKLCSVADMAQMSPQVYLKHLSRQCETHKSLRHENIVKLYEVVQLDKTTYCMVLEFCQGPQLSKYLKKKGFLSQEEAKSIMFQVFQTLYYLSICSSKKIVHYDLKPQNIMFHQGLIKILDFGLNKQIDEQQSRAALTTAGLGTHAYLPPQVHQYDSPEDRVLSNKVDIWSSGIIFYELLHGKKPTKLEDIQFQKQSSKNISQQTIQIIRKCLQIDPSKRITPQEVYFHPYFDEFQRKYERNQSI